MPHKLHAFFIAFAGHNHPQAKELYELLGAKVGRDRVFLDSESMTADERFYVRVPAAQRDSRVTVALIGPADTGRYNRDELHAAIALERADPSGHTVMPVFLVGIPQNRADWEYGTQTLQPVDASGPNGLRRAADVLVDRLREIDPSAVYGVLPKGIRNTLGAALELDRKDQWHDLTTICRKDGPAWFLIWGDYTQALDAFLDRISRRLDAEAQLHHRIEVPYRRGSLYATAPAEWEGRLATVLRERLNAGKDVSCQELLQSATAERPVFLTILFQYNAPLERAHIKAVGGFIRDRLPDLTAGLKGKHVRLLVAVEHIDGAADQRHEIVDGLLLEASRKHKIPYKKLKRATLPTRDEVIDYLESLGLREGRDPIFDAATTGYDLMTSKHPPSFRDLVEMLDRELESADGDRNDSPQEEGEA